MEVKEQVYIKDIDYKTAKELCEKYHYSKSAPQGKYKFGVYIGDKLIGCILFGKGANNQLAKHFGVEWNEIFELTRIALDKHEGYFTTQFMSMCIKELNKREREKGTFQNY